MPLINTADKLYLGTTPVLRAYKAGVLVWPPAPTIENTLSAVLARKGSSADLTCSASWSGTTPTLFKYYLSTNGGAWVLKGSTAATTLNMASSYNSSNQAKIESFDGSVLLKTAYSNTVAIGSAPPPPTQQRTWQAQRSAFASYNGNGTKRTDSDGTTYGYSGYYSGTHGNQKCCFKFDIPNEIRNCKSIDKVEFWGYNLHSYYNSGRQLQVAIHHGDLSNSGSSATFVQAFGGKPGQIGGGNPNDGWDWIDITNHKVPGRYIVKEEFRIYGAQGIAFNPGPSNAQDYYGYVRNDIHLRITYTVYT